MMPAHFAPLHNRSYNGSPVTVACPIMGDRKGNHTGCVYAEYRENCCAAIGVLSQGEIPVYERNLAALATHAYFVARVWQRGS
jgi:hypothetical protein